MTPEPALDKQRDRQQVTDAAPDGGGMLSDPRLARISQRRQAADIRGQTGTEAGPGGGAGYHGDFDRYAARILAMYGIGAAEVEFDESGEGVRPGAIATTRGATIHVGEPFAALAPAEQDRVLAHELAHVAQAAGADTAEADTATAAADTATAEADADRAAASALDGQPTEVEHEIEPGVPHDHPIGDALNDALSAVGDAALDAAIALIDNAAAFASLIARFGEAAGRKAIDFLAAHKQEILFAVLAANPGIALLVYAFQHLPVEQLCAFVRSVDLATAGHIITQVVLAGCVINVVLMLTALGPLGGPLMRQIQGPAIVLLMQQAPAEIKALIVESLIDLWPVGLGFEVEGSIGATFGYPIHLGIESFATMLHASPGVLELQRGGFLTEAFDSGVGAGGFIGLGGKDGKGGGKGGGLGIGAEAGAEVQAGFKQYVLQTFSFPLAEDEAFTSFLLASTGADVSASMQLLGHFVPAVKAVDPARYNTKTKFELKAFAQASAGASAGLRTAGDQTQDGGSTWTSQDGKGDTGQKKWWQYPLQASALAQLGLEAATGVEVRPLKPVRDATGEQAPSVVEVEIYAEGSARLQIAARIPGLSDALPPLPDLDGGIGIKVMWTLTGPSDAPEPQVSPPKWSFYAKSGDLDRYQGAASEVSVGLKAMDPDEPLDLETFLGKIDGGCEVKRRFSVATGIGRHFLGVAQRQHTFDVLLKGRYQHYGLTVEGYFDVDAGLSVAAIRTIFREVAGAIDAYRDGEAPFQALLQDVLGYLLEGKAPERITGHATAIANVVLAAIKKLSLRAQVGLGLAAGAKAGAGAKVRAQGHVEGKVVFQKDLLAGLKGQITVADIQRIIENVLDEGVGVVDLAPIDG